LDLATILGIIAGAGAIGFAMVSGGGLSAFLNIPSLMLVVGGTVAATLIKFPLGRVLSVMGVVKNAFMQRQRRADQLLPLLIELARKARREGLISLEGEIQDGIREPFLVRGLQMAVDGMPPELMRQVLDTEIEAMGQRHQQGQEILKTMGSFAPSFGMIGTLVGLIQMLRVLNDPKSLGPSMAIALITTLYGALMAYLLFLPLAGKLELRSQEEILFMEVVREGVISIAQGDNPTVMEEKLKSFLAPGQREQVNNGEEGATEG